MEITLDRNSEIPLGVQLAWALRARILAGHMSPGDRLPGVRELAAETGVNINTVRSVYARLEADGMTRSEHGRGTFVQAIAPADEQVAEVARRALEEATTAGLDPRDVAAALYARVGVKPAGPAQEPADDPATRRRALREEIASLERELADERLKRALRDAVTEPPRSVGARLLSEEELRAQRDRLAERLVAVQKGEPETPVAEPQERPQPKSAPSATRPGIVMRPVYGA